jgi:hypothetical protein
MRWFSTVIAFVALILVGASAPGAVTRTAPRVTATATAAWWHQTVRITYANGAWEYGYRRWYGLADSPVSPTVWVSVDGGWRQQWPSLLVGSRIEMIGEPYRGW